MASGNPSVAAVLGFVSDQIRLSIIEARRHSPVVEGILDVTIADTRPSASARPPRRAAPWARTSATPATAIGLPLPDED